MAINFHNAVGTYESALKLRSQRAEVLSSNLANSDTPNFKARDFDFQKAMSAQAGQKSYGDVRATHRNHLGGGVAQGAQETMLYRTPSQPSVDGNTVDEHLEHSEFMANSLEFQTAFTLLNSRFKGLLSAIRGE